MSLTFSSPVALVAQTRVGGEYEVKAAFLYNFAKFVEWPSSAFRGPEDEITFCIYGDDPFDGALERIVAGKKINERNLRVLRPRQVTELRSCHILFTALNDHKRLAELLAGIRGAPILTAGDAAHFIQTGGMIGFVINENKVRFEVNLTAAGQSHLTPSSKLLALATSVIGNARAGPDQK